MKKINALLSELEQYIPVQNQANPTVSQGSVGWHLEHILLTINQIIKGVRSSKPEDYHYKFNPTKTMLSLFGKIPRGRIKAPASVQPTVEYNENSLSDHLAKTRVALDGFDTLQPNQFFKHPFLGDFNLKATIRFLQIHTAHHLKIIKDIVKRPDNMN